MDDLTVEDGTAKLRMDYETVDDYTAFNGVELYEGKIVQALAAGYDFDTDFVGVDKDSILFLFHSMLILDIIQFLYHVFNLFQNF